MRNVLLQSTIDLSTSGTTAAQFGLAVFCLLVFGAVLVIGSYAMQFVGLSDEQTRHKKALLGQREAKTGATLRINADEDIDAVWSDIRALFDGDSPRADAATTRTAVAAVKQELGEVWSDRASRIPKLARWLLELAALLTIAASLVHISLATYRRVFGGAGSGLPSLSEIVADAVWAVQQVASLATNSLGAFPFADTLWAFTFAYTIRFITWLYNSPAIVIAVLVASAIGIIWLDRQAPSARGVRVTTRFSVWTFVFGFALVWLAGAVPAALGNLAGLPSVGAFIGLLLAFGTACGLAYLIGRALMADVRALVRVAEDPDRPAMAYLAVRRIGAAAASLAAPLVPIYLLAAIVNGQLAGIVQAFVAGSILVQIAVGLVVLVFLGALAWVARDAAGEVSAALRNLSTDTAVKLALFGRGVPVVVMVTVYLLALGFQLPWVAGLGFAFVAGLLARGLYAGARALRYRTSQIESSQRTPSQVQIRAYQLEAANGETRYYADVNSTRVAHDDPDAMAEAVCGLVESLFAGEDPSPTVERVFARDMLQFGIIDIDETREKLRQVAREEATGRMPKDLETIEERVLQRVPEDIWDEVREKKVYGRGDWRVRNGRLLPAGS